VIWVLSLISAGLLIASVPGYHAQWLAWVALAPLLYAMARETRPAIRFLAGLAAGAFYWWIVCFWIEYVLEFHGGMSLALAWLAFVLFGFYKALHLAVFSLLAGWIPLRWWTPLAWAALWVGIERTHGSFGFAWVPLGGSGIDTAWLLRAASFVGVYGLSFVYALAAAMLAAVVLVRSPKPLALVPVCFLPMLLPALPAPEAGGHQAVVVQPAMPEEAEWTREFLDQRLGRLAFQSFRNAAGHPHRLIVWPEMPGPIYFESDPEFHQLALDIATRNDDYFLFGTTTRDAKGNPYNSGIMVNPDGGVAGRYDKINLVPFGEFVPSAFSWVNKITDEPGDFVSGTRLTLFPVEGDKAGVFICYESAFPDYVRQFANNGAAFFVNLSNDGYFGHSKAREQHLAIVRMRAAENRRWIIRATNNGITAVADPAGRVTDRVPEWAETSQIVSYGIEHETTFYSRHGDWFAWLCLAAGLSTAFAALVRFRLQSVRHGSARSQ
jgi:apolipoprotein N-acyltransferase